MSPLAVMANPKPSTTKDISGKSFEATWSASRPIMRSWSSSFASSATIAQAAMKSPPPTQTTAAPTWSILKTKYHWVPAANTIEMTSSASPIALVAITDVRRRLSGDAAATASGIDPPR
jgi:hypothetical protein